VSDSIGCGAVPGLAGKAIIRVGGNILEAVFLGEFDSATAASAVCVCARRLEFGVGERLDAERRGGLKPRVLAVWRNSEVADSGLTSRVDSRRESKQQAGLPSLWLSPTRGERMDIFGFAPFIGAVRFRTSACNSRVPPAEGLRDNLTLFLYHSSS